MKKIDQNCFHRNHRAGFILPLILVALVVCNIFCLVLSTRFSGAGSKEYLRAQFNSRLYSAAMTGINLGLQTLKVPGGTPVKWADGTVVQQTYTSPDGATSTSVSVEHTYMQD